MPLTLRVIQLPPLGYVVRLEMEAWAHGEAYHSPIGAGRTDLLVTPDAVPARLLAVAVDLSGLVLARRNLILSARLRQYLAACEEHAWISRHGYSLGRWRDMQRLYLNSYASPAAFDRLTVASQTYAGMSPARSLVVR